MRRTSLGGVASTASTPSYPTQLADVLHREGYGQSTSIGVGGRTGEQYTTGLYGALTFNTGLRVSSVDKGGTPTSLVPAVESLGSSNYGETGVVAGCNTFVEKLAALGGPPIANRGFVMFAATGGRGGSSIAALSKGTARYAEMLAQITDASRLARAANLTYAALSMPLTLGEADTVNGTEGGIYKQGVSKLIADFIADTQAATGQKIRPFLVQSQLASHMAYYEANSAIGFRPIVALAQREMAAENADIFTVCPRYILSYTDDIHHDSFAYTTKGIYFGLAEAEIVRARQSGDTRKPIVALDFRSAVWQGKLIDLEFGVPAPLPGQAANPLVFDTTQVTAAPNRGFDLWAPNGTTLVDTIADVAIKGPNRVVIRLSAEPVSGARLSYGFGRPGVTNASGPSSGPRGNLRDSRGDVHAYTRRDNKLQRLDSWCLVFETIKP